MQHLLGAIALISCATMAAAADTPPKVALVPAATFADQPFFSKPVLSPDGKTIAARASADGKTRLVIFPTHDAAHPNIYDLGDASIVDINWAGPGRVLLTIAITTDFYGLKIPVTRLMGIDATPGGTVKYLDPKSRGLWAGEVLYADPAGSWIVVASQNDIGTTPSVKRIDLVTGAVTVIEKARDGVWDWYADNAGVVRAGVSYSNDRWTVWYREKPEDPLKPIRSKVSKDDKGAVDGMRFLSGDNSGMIITNSRTGRFAAYRFDFKTGTVGDAIYENPEVDLTSVIVDPITGVVSGITYEDDRRRVKWLDKDMQALQARVEKALPNAEDIILNRSTDGNRMLIWSGGAADPGAYYLYDRAAKRIDSFARPYAALDDVKLSPVISVRYKARDGLTIPGYLTIPVGKPDQALPLIVMPHGGPFARDSWDYDPYVQFLASRGYAVLQPNFRGSTGYGKDYVEKGYGQWGRAMQDDVDDGVDWLIKSGKVDAKRVCIMGASYGGYAALWGAIRNPEKYRCAVSLSGVTDLPGMLKFDRRSFSAPRYFREWQKHVQGEEKIDLDSVSPLAQAARLTVPVFIAHGEKDDNVPPKQAHQMIKALKGRPNVDSIFYKEEGHGLTKKENLADFFTRLDAFLAKHNPS
jgi:dipeptidyl aminopeptidase/acylaminoacyl peptidase